MMRKKSLYKSWYFLITGSSGKYLHITSFIWQITCCYSKQRWTQALKLILKQASIAFFLTERVPVAWRIFGFAAKFTRFMERRSLLRIFAVMRQFWIRVRSFHLKTVCDNALECYCFVLFTSQHEWMNVWPWHAQDCLFPTNSRSTVPFPLPFRIIDDTLQINIIDFLIRNGGYAHTSKSNV